MVKKGVDMSRAKILLVDDNRMIRDVIRIYLDDNGYGVLEAADYAQAISQMDASIDIALVDIVLPDKSGLDLLNEINQHYPTCPVIIISGHASKRNAIDALHKGAADYLEKPVNLDELAHVIKRCLSHRALSSENSRLKEEQRLQHELRESESRYRLLVESLPDAILVHGEDRIVYANPAALTLVGAGQASELIGRSILDFVPVDARPMIQERIRTVLEEKASQPCMEQTLLRLDGSPFTGLVAGIRITHEGRDAVQVVVKDITERKQGEDALRASEARLRKIVMDAPIPIMVHAEDGEVMAISGQWAKISGYSHAEIPNIDDWMTKAYDMNRQQASKVFRDLYDRKKYSNDGEFSIRTSGGEHRFWDFRSTPLGRLADGRRFVVSMAMDITERKQVEQRLKESEARLQSMLEANPVPTIITRMADGTVKYANQRIEDCFGVKSEVLIGEKTPDFFVHPEERAVLMQELAEKGLLPGREIQVRKADGTLFWARTTLCMFQLDGESCVMASLYDITERKQAEQALAESEEQLHGIIEAAPNAIVSVDEEHRIVVFNKGAEQMFGYSSEEVLGQQLDLLIPEALRAVHRKHRDGFFASGELTRLAHMRPEVTALRKNGEVFPATGSIAKSMSKGKTIVTAILNDISERKQAERALQGQLDQMQRFNKMAVGRELRMIELKKEINALLAELDREQKYTIHAMKESGDSGAEQ